MNNSVLFSILLYAAICLKIITGQALSASEEGSLKYTRDLCDLIDDCSNLRPYTFSPVMNGIAIRLANKYILRSTANSTKFDENCKIKRNKNNDKKVVDKKDLDELEKVIGEFKKDATQFYNDIKSKVDVEDGDNKLYDIRRPYRDFKYSGRIHLDFKSQEKLRSYKEREFEISERKFGPFSLILAKKSRHTRLRGRYLQLHSQKKIITQSNKTESFRSNYVVDLSRYYIDAESCGFRNVKDTDESKSAFYQSTSIYVHDDVLDIRVNTKMVKGKDEKNSGSGLPNPDLVPADEREINCYFMLIHDSSGLIFVEGKTNCQFD